MIVKTDEESCCVDVKKIAPDSVVFPPFSMTPEGLMFNPQSFVPTYVLPFSFKYSLEIAKKIESALFILVADSEYGSPFTFMIEYNVFHSSFVGTCQASGQIVSVRALSIGPNYSPF